MRLTYIGHATLLIEIGGRRFITDPNYEPKLGRFLPRVSAPGVALEALPKLDAILLTHAHADHLSFTTLDRLPQDIPLFAPPAVARWIGKRYRHVVAIAPGASATVAGVRLSAALATHRGHRYGFDRWRGDANMYLLDDGVESCFFAGDTALTDGTHDLVKRELWAHERELDVALLPIGWAPRWKYGFRKGHLTSEDALALLERLRARMMIPYHWGTFHHVTSRAFDAIERLRALIPLHSHGSRVHVIEPGESVLVPALAAAAG
ncbi:MAG: beta-lactamase domain protein [Gemmatimonadetes bacterium]|nr:beta-lactamase domain protein [Gemmatimonadota bacterium]